MPWATSGSAGNIGEMLNKLTLLLWLALALAAAGYFEGPLGWRVNGGQVYRTAGSPSI